MDKIVIPKVEAGRVGTCLIRISPESMLAIQKLADESGQSKSYVDNTLILRAIELGIVGVEE